MAQACHRWLKRVWLSACTQVCVHGWMGVGMDVVVGYRHGQGWRGRGHGSGCGHGCGSGHRRGRR
eukprot:9452627-Lingulodinium_polyedra.AAC.1